jgi:hypothetical protein
MMIFAEATSPNYSNASRNSLSFNLKERLPTKMSIEMPVFGIV